MTAVLHVGDRAITPQELLPLLQQYGMLPQLLREVIIDQAIAPVRLEDDAMFKAYQQFYQQHQLKTDADLQAWLANQGLSREQLDAKISRALKLERFKQETWEHKLETTFLQRKSLFDRVIYSLIRVRDLGIAQELYFRIQEHEVSFADLARQHSQGSEAQTGGLIGPVELRVPSPALAKLLLSSQPGQLLPPTRIGEWFVVVRLENYFPAQLDDAMRQRLLNDLMEEWLQAQTKSELARLQGTPNEVVTPAV